MPRHRPGRPTRVPAAAVLTVLLALGLVGCAGQPQGAGTPTASGEGPSSGPAEPLVTAEVYGDSLTVADSPDLRSGRTGPESWVHHVARHGVDVVGAAGRWGATADEVLHQHLRLGQEDVDAEWLVLFLGTNDAGRAGTPEKGAFSAAHADFVEQLAQIAAETGHRADRVVVVQVGPSDAGLPERTQAWNALTEAAAQERGWHLVDPWEGLRSEDGRYADRALSIDGLHLSEAGAQLLADGLAQDLLAVAGQGR